MANRWLETEALSPAALEELNPTNSHVHLQGDRSEARRRAEAQGIEPLSLCLQLGLQQQLHLCWSLQTLPDNPLVPAPFRKAWPCC